MTHQALESSRFLGGRFLLDCACGTTLPVPLVGSWPSLNALLRMVWSRHAEVADG